jgi:hypothetical protein
MQLIWPAPNRKFGFVDALGVTGVVGLLVARFIPVARLIPFWGCLFRKLTGWPCPGCGLTRVADRFAHGHFLGAIEANPLGTLAAVLFALAALLMVLHLVFKMPIPEVKLGPKETRWLRWGGAAALVVNYAFVAINTRFPDLW